MPKYEHIYDISFAIATDKPESNVTEREIAAALLQRLDHLLEMGDLKEAIGVQTFEEEENG